jgi:hypothetical protein
MKRDTLSLLAAICVIVGGSRCLEHCPLPGQREAQAKVGGDTAPDGTAVQIDLPADKQMHNVGGSDGAGLCVFTSINHAAIWQNVVVLKDFQKWMRSKPGGGYPDKVDRMISQKCKEARVEAPQFIQVEGSDLEVIKLACATGRMPCVTYGFSPSGRYGGQRISHMVNCVHADGKNYAVLDNNFPEELEWLSEQEFSRAYSFDGGWTIVLLNPGPPPPPRNMRRIRW